MGYYPVFLDLQGRPCVVIGTGPEAERKVHGLLEAGAQVTVVANRPSHPLEELETQGRIVLHRRPYSEGDLAGAFLAIAATTEDVDLSKRIADEAERERVLLNVMDVTALCTWIAPALVHRGKLTMAISTSGLSPAMARLVREELDESIPEEYGTLLEIVAEVRRRLRRRGVRPHPDAWNAALNGDIKALVAEGDLEGVTARLLELLDPQHSGGEKERPSAARR